MKHLIYYFPGKHGVTADLIRDVGLSVVTEGLSPAYVEVMGGPDGGNGCCAVFHRGETLSVKFQKDQQHWRECAGGAFWIGYYKDAVPGPDDLKRAVQVAGHPVELTDGNRWLIPLVRQFDGETAVPRVIRYRADGSFEHDINPKYTDFYERGMAVWEHVTEHGQWGPSEEWVIETAIQALTVNYHIGKWEASTLGIIDTRNAAMIVQAVVDGPTYERWKVKKNKVSTVDTSSHSDGSEDSSQDIDQPAQI